jgi:hypothetical protein
MAHVNIVKRIKSDGRWIMRSLPKKSSGEWDWKALPEGRYYIEWYEGGARRRQAAGTRSVQLSGLNLGLLHTYMAQAFRRKIDHHRVETAVKPEKKGLQVPFARPDGWDSMPSVQLLLKDFIADLCQIFERLLIGFPLWQQIYGRFQPYVAQCQVRAGWIPCGQKTHAASRW